MKKILLVLALMVTAVSFGQLNDEAQFFKSSDSDSYECIKNLAVEKWNDDHEMIVHEINKQSKSKMEFLEGIRDKDQDGPLVKIALKAMKKWGETPCTIDWEMTLYEYNKQIKAASQY